MPASTIENQNAVVSRSYGSTGEMFVRRVSSVCDVADRKHPFCARGSEKIDVTVAMVASDSRAAVLARPQP